MEAQNNWSHDVTTEIYFSTSGFSLILHSVQILENHEESIFLFCVFQLGPNSGLHIIIFDEIDAICKARGTVVSKLPVYN